MANRSQQQRKVREGKPDQPEPATPGAGPRPWMAAILLAFSVSAVYAPALHAPFIFDDRNGIVDNESIRHLWPLIGPAEHPGPLNPPPELPTSARPLANLSLALNYHFGGINPFGYHVFSAVLHFLSAILLWAIVRRTLLLPYFNRRFDASAGWLSLAVAELWALHPLATESVIYATQRTELIMAFFYLATLYCSLRYWTSLPLPPGEGQLEGALPERRPAHPIAWLSLAVCACLAGMASKEVMVSAPVMALLYERTFIAGSLNNALRRSWPLYVGLAATWILLLIVSLRAHYGTAAGFEAGVPAHHWWLTQAKVFLLYLKLTLWPSPLLIHYELPYLTTFAESWIFVLPVFVMGIVTFALLWRNHPAGYLSTLIFAILAPTSLIPIRLEMAAERRMYLPLAAVVVLIVVGGYSLVQNLRRKSNSSRYVGAPQQLWAGISALVVLVALALVGVSTRRLATYNNEMALWQEVLQNQPNNLVAHNNVGLILTNAGRLPEAIQELQATVAIKPNYVYGLNNLGNALSAAGRLPEAVQALERAVQVDPDYFQARNNLGVALMRMGRLPQAIEQLQQALRLQPHNNEVRINLGSAFVNSGRIDDSIREYESVLAEDPDNVLALINLSIPLARAGRVPEAIERVQHALRLQPDNPDAHTNLGLYLAKTGKTPQAMEQFRLALERNPNDVNAHFHYGNSMIGAGRPNDAIPHFVQALRLQPNFPGASASLGLALQQAGRPREAAQAYEVALQLKPDAVDLYNDLADVYFKINQPDKAIAALQSGRNMANSHQDGARVDAFTKRLRNAR